MEAKLYKCRSGESNPDTPLGVLGPEIAGNSKSIARAAMRLSSAASPLLSAQATDAASVRPSALRSHKDRESTDVLIRGAEVRECGLSLSWPAFVSLCDGYQWPTSRQGILGTGLSSCASRDQTCVGGTTHRIGARIGHDGGTQCHTRRTVRRTRRLISLRVPQIGESRSDCKQQASRHSFDLALRVAEELYPDLPARHPEAKRAKEVSARVVATAVPEHSFFSQIASRNGRAVAAQRLDGSTASNLLLDSPPHQRRDGDESLGCFSRYRNRISVRAKGQFRGLLSAHSSVRSGTQTHLGFQANVCVRGLAARQNATELEGAQRVAKEVHRIGRSTRHRALSRDSQNIGDVSLRSRSTRRSTVLGTLGHSHHRTSLRRPHEVTPLVSWRSTSESSHLIFGSRLPFNPDRMSPIAGVSGPNLTTRLARTVAPLARLPRLSRWTCFLEASATCEPFIFRFRTPRAVAKKSFSRVVSATKET